jgi:SAM-dependent methyltransferase
MDQSSPDLRPLHQQNPTTRFTSTVADYVRFRPGYPDEAFDAMVEGLPRPVAADIGAGTGISTNMLLARCARVFAVEPNTSMSAASVAAHPALQWVAGRAEATTLAPGSVDLVLCAQSYHWFDPPPALQEFSRILRPGRRLALLWNIRDEADPVSGAYTRAIREITGNQPAEMRGFDPASVTATGAFATESFREFSNSQTLDHEGFLGRARSASYVPKSGSKYEQLMQELTRIHSKYADGAGLVRMKYVVRLFTYSRCEHRSG